MSKVGTIMKVGGKVGGRAAGRAVNILPLITEAIGYYKIRSEERTKREEIWAKRDVLVTALNNEKEIILTYFEHRFAERKMALEQFYRLLHRAVDSGNDNELQVALNGILGIIQENPLKDFAEFKKNMSNPDFVIEL